MARLDYFAIESAVKQQILDTSGLGDVQVVVERQPSHFEGPQVFIYLERRAAPAELQTLSAGLQTRFLITISVWCFETALELDEAARKRDDLVGKVELALMRDRTFGGIVRGSWLEGGEFDNVGGNAGFTLGAQIALTLDAKATN